MSTVNLLRAVRAVVSTPWTWTQRTPARDIKGRPCSAASAAACSWCLIGAMSRVVGGDVRDYRKIVTALHAQLDKGPSSGGALRELADFNDESWHWQVLKLIDAAIAAEEG